MSLFEFNEVNISACRPSSETLHEISGSDEGLWAEMLTSLNSNTELHVIMREDSHKRASFYHFQEGPGRKG